jgi:hypothetical protein
MTSGLDPKSGQCVRQPGRAVLEFGERARSARRGLDDRHLVRLPLRVDADAKRSRFRSRRRFADLFSFGHCRPRSAQPITGDQLDEVRNAEVNASCP